MSKRFEPDLTLDGNAPNLVQQVRAWTGGLGADVVVCANPSRLDPDAGCPDRRVRVAAFILFGGLPKANPMTSLDGNAIHYGEIEVVGAFSYHPTALVGARPVPARCNPSERTQSPTASRWTRWARRLRRQTVAKGAKAVVVP